MIITLIIRGSTGLMVDFSVESVDAWHSQFTTKKECTNFMKDLVGNAIAEANAMCQKILPH